MDIRLTFDGVAEVYERARPSYPAQLFKTLFDGVPDRPRVLEVGPGTGQATVELLARNAHVTAVELGPQFAARLNEKFAANDRLVVINDSFEDADVAHHSFDVVTVATAYHWIGPEAQLSRPVELLTRGGVLGVIDLIQVDATADDGYFDRVLPIYERYGQAKSNSLSHTYEHADPPMRRRLADSKWYTEVELLRVPWDQTYTSAHYRDLLWSCSGTQMMSEPERSNMVDELIAVIDDEHNGQLTRPLVATLTKATVR